jgi:two-component system response regulator PilR (NtrC family)
LTSLACTATIVSILRKENFTMTRILLVDDEPSILSVLSTVLKAEGHDVVPVNAGDQAKTLLQEQEFDLMISDIRMSPINGMELLRTAHKKSNGMPVIMLTAFGTVETAVEALKLGAFDYLTKPFKVDELLITVKRALDYSNALSENASLKKQLQTRYEFENIVAESPAMRNVCDMIRRVAPTDTTILICGESGTGKELVAKAVHAHSKRVNGPFMPVNCAALPEPLLESEMFGHVKGAFTGASADKQGLFESANGGTIFLDEISSMPMSLQSKLLRVLQEKEVRRVGSNETIKVDARVLAATNVKLEKMIEKGEFHEDLFYRLSVIPIQISPLRDRREDILPLFDHFLKNESHGEPPTTEPAVAALVEAYSWPGNVRELENAARHAIAFAQEGHITPASLPARITTESNPAFAGGTHPSTAGFSAPAEFDSERCKSLRAFLRSKEKEYVSQVLTFTGGNKEEAAKALKISLATLYRKLPEEE